MKKRLFVITALAAALASPLAPALAAPGGPGPGLRCDKPAPGERGERLAELLDLSAEQREQIRAIRESERKAAAPLRQQLAEGREKLHAAIDADPFDEAAIRALAAGQEATRTELTVARARMQSRIKAVFTPEQRRLSEKLRPLLQERRGERRHFRGGEEETEEP